MKVKAPVGAFSVIVKTDGSFAALAGTASGLQPSTGWGDLGDDTSPHSPGCSRRPNTRAVSLSCQVDIIYFFTLNCDEIFVLLDLSTFSGMQLNKPKSNLIFDICLPSPEAEVTVTNPSPWPCQCPTNQIPGLVPGAWSVVTASS